MSLNIGIVTALRAEAAVFGVRKLSIGQTVVLKNNLRLHRAGMGAERARLAANHLIENGATALISWGVAGGLAPHVHPGQLILPDHIIDQNGRSFPVDQPWRTQLQNNLPPSLPILNGSLLQASQLITSVAEKQQLFIQYQAIAVDMETAAIAAVAQRAHLPFLAIRAIVDPIDFTFPAWLHQSLDAAGEIKIPTLMKNLCRQPHRLRTLVQLSRYFAAAKTTLNKAREGLTLIPPIIEVTELKGVLPKPKKKVSVAQMNKVISNRHLP